MSLYLNSFSKKTTKKQKGFSLIELVMVLAVISMLTIGVISKYNSANDTQQAQEEVEHINDLSTSVKSMFSTQGNYNGLTNEVVTASVSFPKAMRVPGANEKIKSAWADDGYKVTPSSEGGSPDDHFTMVVTKVPKGACVSISSSTYKHYEVVKANDKQITGVANATTACKDKDNIIKIIQR